MQLLVYADRAKCRRTLTRLKNVLSKIRRDAVPHGFRSAFRDWAAERTTYPNEVAEMALAHAVGNKVEAAYRRGDLFEKHLAMMDEWPDFCSRCSR